VIYRVFVILLPLKFHPKLFLHHKSLYPLDLIFFPEKKKGKEKLWNRVKTNDGKYKEDIVSILEEQVNFFEKLFTSEGWDSDSAAYLFNNLEKKLSQEDKEICDEGITLDEISKAVKLQILFIFAIVSFNSIP
jgi:hypothetical protein